MTDIDPGSAYYEKRLSDCANKILGNNETIKLDELKQSDQFKSIFSNLKENDRNKIMEKIDYLASLDNDGDQTVSYKELKAILFALDAKYDKENDYYQYDGEFDFDDSSALKRIDKEALDGIYSITLSKQLSLVKQKTAEYPVKNDDGTINKENIIKNIIMLNKVGILNNEDTVGNIYNWQVEIRPMRNGTYNFTVLDDNGNAEYELNFRRKSDGGYIIHNSSDEIPKDTTLDSEGNEIDK